MKKILFILSVVLILTGNTYGQVVIEATTGIAASFVYPSSPTSDAVHIDAVTGATANLYSFFVGRAYMWSPYYYGNWQAVMEFDIAGLPTADMTSQNWTAQINSISDTGGGFTSASATMFVDLFDLNDDAEDGNITMADFDNALPGSASIAQRKHIAGYGGPSSIDAVVDDPDDGLANFTNIDVTEQLRRDLFGDGTGDTTSGFVLIASPYDANQYTFFASEVDGGMPPNLTITVNTGDGSSNDCFIDTVK